jgi:hypothetical protein
MFDIKVNSKNTVIDPLTFQPSIEASFTIKAVIEPMVFLGLAESHGTEAMNEFYKNLGKEILEAVKQFN